MLVGERQGPAVVIPSEAQVDANGLGKVLKGDAPITATQFKTYLKGLMR